MIPHRRFNTRRARAALAAIVGASQYPFECVEWTGVLDHNGYGSFGYRSQKGMAHKAIYELLVGPVRPGLELDHLCRNRRCVNPCHMEQVTHAENMRRGGQARYVPNYPCGHLKSESAWTGACSICRNAQRRKNPNPRPTTHCPHGHEFTPENTKLDARGWRTCRACKSLRNARAWRAKSGKDPAEKAATP